MFKKNVNLSIRISWEEWNLAYSQFSHKTMYLDANWQSIDILSEIASIWNGNGHNFEIGKVFCILWNNQNSLALVIIFGKVVVLY